MKKEPTEAEIMLMEDYGMTIDECRRCFITEAMERYARKKNQELQLLVNILTPKKTLKCSCLEPQPNYPEMVWCDKCGYEMPNVKYCTCSPDPKCRIKSNKVYCNDCNLERK